MSNGPIEPSAEIRQMAKAVHEMFVGLKLEGFTEAQALKIIGHLIAAGNGEK